MLYKLPVDFARIDSIEEWVATSILQDGVSPTRCLYRAMVEFGDQSASLLLLAYASFLAALEDELDLSSDDETQLLSAPLKHDLTWAMIALVVDVTALQLSMDEEATGRDVQLFWLETDDKIFTPRPTER